MNATHDTLPVLHPRLVDAIWVTALIGLWPVLIVGSSVLYYRWRKADPARAQAVNAVAWKAFWVGIAMNLALSLFIVALNHTVGK